MCLFLSFLLLYTWGPLNAGLASGYKELMAANIVDIMAMGWESYLKDLMNWFRLSL